MPTPLTSEFIGGVARSADHAFGCHWRPSQCDIGTQVGVPLGFQLIFWQDVTAGTCGRLSLRREMRLRHSSLGGRAAFCQKLLGVCANSSICLRFCTGKPVAPVRQIVSGAGRCKFVDHPCAQRLLEPLSVGRTDGIRVTQMTYFLDQQHSRS